MVEIRRRASLNGVSIPDLAHLAGTSPRSLSAELAANVPNHNLRARLEIVLGSPIWCTPTIFALRQFSLAKFGFDPLVESRPDLLERARAFQLLPRKKEKLPRLQAMLLKFLGECQARVKKAPNL